MTLLVRVAALAAAVLLAGCYPTSVHPIGSTAPSIDARLTGAWKALPKDKKDNPTYVFFLQRKEGTEAVMVGAPDKSDDGGGWITFSVTTVKLGGNTFMSGRTLLDDGKASKDPDYTPVFYRVEGQMLRLYVLGTDAIEAAINKGEIKGEIKKSSYGDDVRITADAKAVDAFFASHDPKKLFTEELGTYRRLR